MSDKPLYTISEIAQALGITYDAAHKLKDRYGIQGIPSGCNNAKLYDLDAMREALEAKEADANAPGGCRLLEKMCRSFPGCVLRGALARELGVSDSAFRHATENVKPLVTIRYVAGYNREELMAAWESRPRPWKNIRKPTEAERAMDMTKPELIKFFGVTAATLTNVITRQRVRRKGTHKYFDRLRNVYNVGIMADAFEAQAKRTAQAKLDAAKAMRDARLGRLEATRGKTDEEKVIAYRGEGMPAAKIARLLGMNLLKVLDTLRANGLA